MRTRAESREQRLLPPGEDKESTERCTFYREARIYSSRGRAHHAGHCSPPTLSASPVIIRSSFTARPKGPSKSISKSGPPFIRREILPMPGIFAGRASSRRASIGPAPRGPSARTISAERGARGKKKKGQSRGLHAAHAHRSSLPASRRDFAARQPLHAQAASARRLSIKLSAPDARPNQLPIAVFKHARRAPRPSLSCALEMKFPREARDKFRLWPSQTSTKSMPRAYIAGFDTPLYAARARGSIDRSRHGTRICPD